MYSTILVLIWYHYSTVLGEFPELILAKTIIRERRAYRDAMVEGKGVVELNNPKARNEIESLGQEIYHEQIQTAET